MIARIAPILRLPANLGVFDYLIPKELIDKIKMGQIVKINFRGEKINGLVTEFKTKSTIPSQKLKWLLGVITASPPLTKNQLTLLKWLADYYYISPAMAAKLVIPEILVKEQKKTTKKILKVKSQNRISNLPLKIEKIAKSIIHSKEKKYLFWHNRDDAKINLILGLIKNLNQKQILILFADQSSLEYASGELKKYFSDFLTITGDLSKKELWRAWQDIKAGKTKVILGTRLAVFYPFTNLKYLVIDEENNPSYKQWEMNPRYDAKTIAWEIAKLHQAKLILASNLPTVDAYWQIKKNKIKLLSSQQGRPEIELIDMIKEMKEGNFSIISQPLTEQIKEKLKQKKQIVLILNRKGYARITLCRDCGFIAECPGCGMTLNLSHNRLKCPNCKFERDNLLFCPHCHNPEIKSFGSGTQKVESEIKKIFPEAKITRLDSDINRKHCQMMKNLWQENKIDILVGTQMVLRPWIRDNLGLVAFINIDTDLSQAGYQTTENALRLITCALNLLNEKNGLFIQTYRIDNPVLKYFTETDWPNFYKKEIQDRQNLHYPPFGALVKLIYQNKNEKKTESTFDKLEKKLKIVYPEEQIFSSKIKKVRRNYQRSILIKSKNPNFRLAKNDLPPDWLIDLTPQSFD